ncbi:MAG: hypothetical protein CMR00_11050 [[Chlorobium] sp. 445]|nr:MAG: hypothetical protein CMR00_11050 [[Chlorobium] sp. 445]
MKDNNKSAGKKPSVRLKKLEASKSTAEAAVVVKGCVMFKTQDTMVTQTLDSATACRLFINHRESRSPALSAKKANDW